MCSQRTRIRPSKAALRSIRALRRSGNNTHGNKMREKKETNNENCAGQSGEKKLKGEGIRFITPRYKFMRNRSLLGKHGSVSPCLFRVR